MKSLYESALSGIINIIDKQIDSYNEQKEEAVDALEDQKDAAVDALKAEQEARTDVLEAQQKQLEEQVKQTEAQIEAKQKVTDSINEEIDAMRDANAERERQINLQKAQYELERMQNQRTILQYSAEKGMHYVTDDSGLRDARQEVEDARLEIEIAGKEKQIDLIEKEIDLLEEQKDALNDQIEVIDEEIDSLNEYYEEMIENTEKMFDEMIRNTEEYWDSLIKSMEDYRSRWEELAELEETAKLMSTLEQLGISTEEILNMSGEAFEKFKNDYVGILADIYSGNSSMTTALADSLGITTDRLGSYIASTQSYIDSLSGVADQIQPVSDAIGDTADNVDRLGSAASSAETGVSSLSDDMSRMNADSSGLSENIAGVSDALNGIPDADKFDAIAGSFTNLGIAVREVANALGVGTEGTVGGLISALHQVSGLSLEGDAEGTGTGIIPQFHTLRKAVEAVTAAVDGGSSGQDSGGKGDGGRSGGSKEKESGGGSGSLTGAIEDMKAVTEDAVCGGGESGGDGAVPLFEQFKEAVDNVSASVGNSDSVADSEDLTGSIISMKETTSDALGESGGDGAIGKFEEFGDTIAEAEGHVQGVIDKINEVDGMHAEATITINIETNGGVPQFAEGTLGNLNFESGSFTAEYGKAHAAGLNGLPDTEKNALVSEYGQPEMTVFPNGETVLTDSPTMMDLPRGTVVFNEDQTKELLDHKITATGKAHAEGTADDGVVILKNGTRLVPVGMGDPVYEMQQKFNSYLDKTGGINALISPVNEIQKDMKAAAERIDGISSVINNKTQNVRIGDVHITCPGVTSQEVMREVGNAMNRQFSGLALAALQESKKR